MILLALITTVGFAFLNGQSNSVLVKDVLYSENEVAEPNYGLRNELQAAIDQKIVEPAYGSLTADLLLTLEDERKISGMAKKTISRYTYELKFYDRVLGNDITTKSGVITGSGDNAGKASSEALKKLVKEELSADKLTAVIAKHNTSLSDCGDLMAKLNRLKQEGELLGLLAVANNFTEEAPCFSAIDALVQEAYKGQQANACRATIMKAKASVVEGNLRGAARTLAAVDPSLDCAAEAEALLDQLIETKNTAVGQQLAWYREYGSRRYPSRRGQRRVVSNLILLQAIGND